MIGGFQVGPFQLDYQQAAKARAGGGDSSRPRLRRHIFVKNGQRYLEALATIERKRFRYSEAKREATEEVIEALRDVEDIAEDYAYTDYSAALLVLKEKEREVEMQLLDARLREIWDMAKRDLERAARSSSDESELMELMEIL